ncbi:carboxypeptidase regulatory-like domain-containing protein [Candidatus Woesearchaeota archaeon]|nr:carboxypeptidase regulatory-like domain-containing protein [Candidatus Woesearchaeota archaeon]
MGISDLTNAHAEIFSFNNYPYSICCKDTLGYPIDNQDTGKYISFLKLSSKTDAHVEQSSSNDYNFNAHISSPFYEIKCNYAQSCNGYDTCLVSISGATDAHISVCDYYPINICCTTQCASIETNCIDGLDNDCDGLKDCADSDCDGSIAGTARAQDTNLPIESVDVSTKKDLTVMKSSTTNQQGVYSINQINCGNYTLTTSHTDYAPSFKSAQVLPNQQLTADFSLVLGTSCEADCTFIADNIVHACKPVKLVVAVCG